MTNPLLELYNEELSYINKLSGEFAAAHPHMTNHLALSSQDSEDPFVAQLMESFAFMSARVRQQLENDHQDIAQSLLQVLYPFYNKPVPACSIVSFESNSNNSEKHVLPTNTQMVAQYDQHKARFSTRFPVTLQPLKLTQAKLINYPQATPIEQANKSAQACMELQFELNESVDLDNFTLNELDFYLNTDIQYTYRLYELLLNQLSYAAIQQGDQPADILSQACTQAMGLAAEQALLPYPPHCSLAHRLITEYFCFTQKFFFVKLQFNQSLSFKQRTFSIYLYLNEFNPHLAKQIQNDSLKLNCSPVINLYRCDAEPIRIQQNKEDYTVLPDTYIQPEHQDVYQIEQVTVHTDSQQSIQAQPFFSNSHHSKQTAVINWIEKRKAAWELGLGDIKGTFSQISLVDSSQQRLDLDNATVQLKVMATHRDLPQYIVADQAQWSFYQEDYSHLCHTKALMPFTCCQYPVPVSSQSWQLISQISQSMQSINRCQDKLTHLKEYLNLYDHTQQRHAHQLINAIDKLTTKTVTRRHPHDKRMGFFRGNHITILCNEDAIDLADCYLFVSILHQFFSESCALNSFVELSLASTQFSERAFWKAQIGKGELL